MPYTVTEWTWKHAFGNWLGISLVLGFGAGAIVLVNTRLAPIGIFIGTLASTALLFFEMQRLVDARLAQQYAQSQQSRDAAEAP